MTTSKRPNRRIRKPLKLAKDHWLYSASDALILYDISSNTLLNWRKDGLPSLKVNGERFFRGCDLNRYQHERRERAKRPCRPHEVYCLHCKNLHSLFAEPYQVEQNKRGSFYICLTCPDTGQAITKFWPEKPNFSPPAELESKSSAESHDYNASSGSAGFGKNPPSVTDALNPENEYLVYRYQFHLIQAKGRNAKTVDGVLRAIRTFQAWIGVRPFHHVSATDIAAFKLVYERGEVSAGIAGTRNEELEPRSRGSSTIVHCFGYLEAFYCWLRQNANCSIAPDLPDYFRPTRHHVQVAAAPAEKHVPSLEELLRIISSMPAADWRQRRDRALVAFLCLSGMRDGAVIGLKLKHINTGKRQIYQDPREIKTKNSKTMRTWWFPVGEEVAGIVVSWIEELKASGLGENDPLFPQTPPTFSSRIVYKPWETATPLRKIVKEATLKAGLPPFHPHAIRAMLACLGDIRTRSFEERKAWSQNLGHQHVATTEAYYAKVDGARQEAIFDDIWHRSSDGTIVSEFLDLVERTPPEALKEFTSLLRRMSR